MSETTPTKHEPKQDAGDKPKIHRVCITCNNMFEVTADNYESKQCRNCHKG